MIGGVVWKSRREMRTDGTGRDGESHHVAAVEELCEGWRRLTYRLAQTPRVMAIERPLTDSCHRPNDAGALLRSQGEPAQDLAHDRRTR